jgi:hypothetical protein
MKDNGVSEKDAVTAATAYPKIVAMHGEELKKLVPYLRDVQKVCELETAKNGFARATKIYAQTEKIIPGLKQKAGKMAEVYKPYGITSTHVAEALQNDLQFVEAHETAVNEKTRLGKNLFNLSKDEVVKILFKNPHWRWLSGKDDYSAFTAMKLAWNNYLQRNKKFKREPSRKYFKDMLYVYLRPAPEPPEDYARAQKTWSLGEKRLSQLKTGFSSYGEKEKFLLNEFKKALGVEPKPK